MKLGFRDIESFVRAPHPAARVILVYGPDNGLMRERAGIIGKSVVSDLADPFNVATFTGDALVADPARLPDEAQAISMMGGSRLIRITDAGDSISPIIKDYLTDPSAYNLVVLEAGELGPKSPLRALCEKSAAAAAVPCYTESERDLTTLIRESVRHAGYQIDADAATWLSLQLIGDRARARMEIAKLLTYMGVPGEYDPAGDARAPVTPAVRITLHDVQLCCGSGGERSFDDLLFAMGSGRTPYVMEVYDSFMAEGTPVVVVLRSLQNHFRRLHQVKSATEAGTGLDAALKALSPPLFFKVEDKFKEQLRTWPAPALLATMSRLANIEAEAKKTGTAAELMLGQMLLALSRGQRG